MKIGYSRVSKRNDEHVLQWFAPRHTNCERIDITLFDSFNGTVDFVQPHQPIFSTVESFFAKVIITIPPLMIMYIFFQRQIVTLHEFRCGKRLTQM